MLRFDVTSVVFARFVVVGGLTAALYTGLLLLIAQVFGDEPGWAAGIAYIVAVTFNYLVHHRWTYRTDRSHRSAGVRYLALVGSLFVIDVGATSLLPGLLDINYGVIQLGLAAAFALATYVGQSRWVFVAKS